MSRYHFCTVSRLSVWGASGTSGVAAFSSAKIGIGGMNLPGQKGMYITIARKRGRVSKP